MDMSQLPTAEREVDSESARRAGSEIDWKEIFHRPRGPTVRCPVLSDASWRR